MGVNAKTAVSEFAPDNDLAQMSSASKRAKFAFVHSAKPPARVVEGPEQPPTLVPVRQLWRRLQPNVRAI